MHEGRRRRTIVACALGGLLVAALSGTATPEDQKLQTLLDEEWEWTLREHPAFATSVGDLRYNDRLEDMSFEAITRRQQHARDLVTRIEAINRPELSEPSQLNYDLMLRGAREEVEGQRFPEELMPITQMGGVHQDIAELAQMIPKFRPKDYEDFIKRLEAVPALVDQTIALMRKGLASNITPPRVTLRDVGRLIANQVVDDPTKSPIYQIVFTDFPSHIPEGDRTRLRSGAAAAIQQQVVPSYRKLQTFFIQEYEPNTRESIGLSSLPDGPAWYAHRVKVLTTLDKSAEEIHAIGVAEVKRIRSEMEAVMRQTGFSKSLSDFFQFLRTDPQFFFTDKNALLVAYRDIAKRIDPELTKLFGTLPRLPYGVVPVPTYSEKTQTTAYYNPGSPEAGRPGLFYANTYDLRSRPKWEMEALTAHEAVPGHHLQIALAQELTDVPNFRRYTGYTAFIEGWGLYAESLGPELGLYKDPYSKFGQLTYEMWRAIRLVVDTGLHAKGWTREQAIKFFQENAGKAQHDIIVEVDRYIVWPGQALAYKIGELKIKELRAAAEKELGPTFSARQFHDHVLGAGAVPLSILESRVTRWVQQQKNGSPSGQ